MEDEPLEAVEALTRLGGIGETAAVVALSTRKRVRVAVKRQRIVRVAHGRLALPTADRGLDAARAVGGFASHLTAAAHHGWKIKFPPEFPQVTVPRARRIPEHPDLLLEVFQRELPAGHRHGWATSPLRTVLDCAADLPFDVALCVADSALRAGDVTPDELVDVAHRRRGPAGDRIRRVAAYADGRAANPFESAMRALCLQAGLPVLPQFEIRCEGMVLHPDLANPLLGIVVEADSYEFHGREPWDHNKDCHRYNALVAAGWRVLRFTWEQVMHYPNYVVRTIRALVAELRQASA